MDTQMLLLQGKNNGNVLIKLWWWYSSSCLCSEKYSCSNWIKETTKLLCFFPWYIYWHTEMWRWTSRWKKSLSLWVSLPFPHGRLSFCHIQYDGINAYFQCKHPSLNPSVLLRFTWLFFFLFKYTNSYLFNMFLWPNQTHRHSFTTK